MAIARWVATDAAGKVAAKEPTAVLWAEGLRNEADAGREREMEAESGACVAAGRGGKVKPKCMREAGTTNGTWTSSGSASGTSSGSSSSSSMADDKNESASSMCCVRLLPRFACEAGKCDDDNGTCMRVTTAEPGRTCRAVALRDCAANRSRTADRGRSAAVVVASDVADMGLVMLTVAAATGSDPCNVGSSSGGAVVRAANGRSNTAAAAARFLGAPLPGWGMEKLCS